MFMVVRYGDIIISEILNVFCISWRKAIRKLWRTHNDLVYLINKCDPIVSILEKRCAKLLWNLFNSDNVLFSRICRYSVYNSDTTMGENIRYFMYKYNISYNDWYGNLSNIYVKIDTPTRVLHAIHKFRLMHVYTYKYIYLEHKFIYFNALMHIHQHTYKHTYHLHIITITMHE